MYLIAIICLMGVLPVVSVLSELALQDSAELIPLVGKWFVFWAVGIRLLTAGAWQVFDPGFTAGAIFGIKEERVFRLVVEIGFGNVAMGLLGILSLFEPAWLAPAAVVGCVFYGLAGFQHVLNGVRTRAENIAMISDLAIFLILAVFLVGTLGIAPA